MQASKFQHIPPSSNVLQNISNHHQPYTTIITFTNATQSRDGFVTNIIRMTVTCCDKCGPNMICMVGHISDNIVTALIRFVGSHVCVKYCHNYDVCC